MPKSPRNNYTPPRSRPSSRKYSPTFASTPQTNNSDSPSSRILRGSRYNGYSSHRSSFDSPSRQMIEEFGRIMLDKDREFQASLDKVFAEQELLHRAALDKVRLDHESVRKSAEMARERYDLEIQKERRRREDEEQQRLDRERAEKEEAEHSRRLARLKKEEEEQKKATAKAKELTEAASRINAEKEKQFAEDAKRKMEKEEAERKAKAAADAAAQQEAVKRSTPAPPVATEPPEPQKASQAPATQPKAQITTQQTEIQSSLVSTIAEREEIHKNYLQIHSNLKVVRRKAAELGKTNKLIGELRRKLKSRVGQLTTDSKSNVEIRKSIVEILKATCDPDFGARSTLDARHLVSKSSPISQVSSSCDMPLLLIYFLHMLCKFVCKQLCTEVGSESNMAEPIMIQVAFIFSESSFQWKGKYSFIDILLAKFHKACPVLFGIYGDETTSQGRERLGWQRIGGKFVPETEHRRRIVGLAMGFASISLRNFSRTTRENPMPNREYWKALACIVNTPDQDITKTHLIVLRALMEKNAERFIQLYGEMAIVAMRHATTEFPARAAARHPNEAREVSYLPEQWKRDLRLSL